jgi:hypothetical protein
MPARDNFSIGVLSVRSSVNIETIRYYERVGLLRKPARTAGGYRLYQPADIGYASSAGRAISASPSRTSAACSILRTRDPVRAGASRRSQHSTSPMCAPSCPI